MLRRRDVLPGQKRGEHVGKTKRGKGTKLMVVADGEGVPLGVLTESASRHEVTLIEKTLDEAVVRPLDRRRRTRKPQRWVYDKAGDSDKWRERMEARGVEFICPHRSNRKKPKRQDGRKLRRYGRRGKIERTISWFGDFRRLVLRYEHEIAMYRAFIHVACLIITLRKL